MSKAVGGNVAQLRHATDGGNRMFESGERVFLPGGSGEPRGLVDQLLATSGIDVLTTFLPGINVLPTSWEPSTTVSGPFAFPGTAYQHLPISYAGLARHFADDLPVDTVVVQVSPPNALAECTLGPSAEFSPLALRHAKRRIAVINHSLPTFAGSPRVSIAHFHQVVEIDEPLVAFDAGGPDGTALRIVDHITPHILDGAALQIGLGKIPGFLLERLTGHRNLRLHTGMLSDAVMQLAEAGALDANWPHATTVFLGSKQLYTWASAQEMIQVRGCEMIHDPKIMAAIDGLVAVNSALEIDLLGQCNLEMANERQISGGGGATDFARAARLSTGGLSIVAIPATFGTSRTSRIVPRLGHKSLVTLPRTDVDLVVTEHGAAHLRGRNVEQRAAALIAIACPTHRPDLLRAWQDMAKTFGIGKV